ncbi:MAG: glycerol-3-phosphate acyltransferase [Bacteriovoracia bacterium]
MMDSPLWLAALLIFAYLVGSLRTSMLFRNLKPGFVFWSLDFLRGALAVFCLSEIGQPLFQPWLDFGSAGMGVTAAFAALFLAVVGHAYSPWKRFQSEVPDVVFLGGLVWLAPIPVAGWLVAWFLALRVTEQAPVSRMIGLLVASILQVSIYPLDYRIWLFGASAFAILWAFEPELDFLLQD